MRHLGDITKISGHEAPVVDVVIGGSPCQDLSIAGKRAGLAGERSGLYMEQIRIIKEMREADVLRGKSGVDVRPRYMVWENVPGAFSSNGGQDFAAVVEEAIRVADPEAPSVPVPEKGWPTSGVYADECGRWSVAWRVLDAQFWGVPQRRRRIALVADFGGLSAPEVLFVRKSVSGNLEPGEQKRKEAAGDAGDGAAGASYAIQGSMIGRADQNCPQGDGVNVDVSFTLNTIDRHAVAYGIGSYHSNAWKSDNPYSGVYEADTAKTLDALNCGYPACNQGGTAVLQPYTAGSYGAYTEGVGTLRASGGDYGGGTETLVKCNHIVRRLTPLECERLQGFPDGWTDIGEWVDSKGKKHKESDSPRYKALGNSIAIPPWKWVCKRLCACYERDATMASLFDGIGGFPYIWEQLNGKGSCLWASEIESFPIAVTKLRFGGEDNGGKEVLLAEAEA